MLRLGFRRRTVNGKNALRQSLEELDKIRGDTTVPKSYLRETVDEYVAQVASLARVLVAQKRYDEADEVFKKAMNINAEQLGELVDAEKLLSIMKLVPTR